MEKIISEFSKQSIEYLYVKLGFISRLVEFKDVVDLKQVFTDSELALYNELIEKIKAYEENIGIMTCDIHGKRIIKAYSYFFQKSLYLDQNEYALEFMKVKSHFIGGYLGALLFLNTGYIMDKRSVNDSIVEVVKEYNTTLSPIAEKWVKFKPHNNFVINIVAFVDFLNSRRIDSFKDFMNSLDELLIIQNRIECIPEYKKNLNQLKELEDSINYAKRIQSSLLPDINSVRNKINSFNAFYKPKDVLSGDFYFFKEFKDIIVVGCGDCTGHGVPGALLTVLSINIMEDILERKHESLSASSFLSQLDNLLVKALNKNHQNLSIGLNSIINESLHDKYNPSETVSVINDGLDLSICFIDKKTKVLTFSGAGLPLFVLNKGEVNEIKQKNNKGLGGLFNFEKTFDETKIDFDHDNVFLLSSDGIIDQFGGNDGRKLMKKRFKELVKVVGQSTITSTQELSFFLDSWMNGCDFQEIISNFQKNSFSFGDFHSLNFTEQVDDITVVSFKV